MPAQSRSDVIWNRLIAGFAGAVVVTLAITGFVVLGGGGQNSYRQATPDDVVRSAVAMVKNGDARLLPNLIYADSEEMRGSLRRLGILLGDMQKLAHSIREKFPDDIARYRKDAEDAIASGKPPPGMLSALTEQLGRRDGPPSPDDEAAMRELAARIFADPFAWIEQNEHRLTTVQVTEDVAAVLVDNKPVAGVGLSLKLDAGKWYVALPTGIPPLNQVMPRAPEQWRMIDSLIKILDNTAVELTSDVEAGRLRSLESIGDKAQEKIIFPGAIWAAAYAADMDARRRIDRNLRQFRERQRAWVQSRTGRPIDGVAGVSDKLVAAMTRVAAKEVEPLVRARTPIRWGDLSDTDFEYAVGQWLNTRGLRISFEGPVAGEVVDAAVEAWRDGPGRGIYPRPPE